MSVHCLGPCRYVFLADMIKHRGIEREKRDQGALWRGVHPLRDSGNNFLIPNYLDAEINRRQS